MRRNSLAASHRHAEVALAGIGEHGDDALAFAEALRDGEGGEDVATRGYAGDQAFLASELLRHLDRLLVADGDELVVDVAVEHRGDETGADALDGVQARLAAAEHG